MRQGVQSSVQAEMVSHRVLCGWSCAGMVAVFVLVLAALVGSLRPAAAQPVIAFSGRVAGDDHRARLILDFDHRPDVSVHYVDSPPRILVDLPQTAFALKKGTLQPRGLFDSIRYGAMGPGRARIVLQTKSPARVDMNRFVKGDGGADTRLVLDVKAVSREVFNQLLKSENWAADDAGTSEKDSVVAAKKSGSHGFTVVVDPGHGGIDSGAVGITGTLEKSVTLAFGKALAADLKAADVNVIMTRDDDEFISLSDRVKIGRENKADLFISIHANTVSTKNVRGATVYTLSDKASDRLSQQVAEHENQADAVAGVTESAAPKGVADILMALTRHETEVFSVSLANRIISSFDGKIQVINNPHRYAGFRVLEAPDVPSVLVELGFLSNPQDEKLLNDPAWRAKTAKLLTKSILTYRSTVLASRN